MVQLTLIIYYLTTKNTKITKEGQNNWTFPLRGLRALRGDKYAT